MRFPSSAHPVGTDRGRRHVLQSSVAALSGASTAQLAAAPAMAVGGDVAVLNNGMKFPKADDEVTRKTEASDIFI